MTTLLAPLELHGAHDAFSVVPFLGISFLLLILCAGLAGFYLWRQGKLTMPDFSTPRPPEEEPRRILGDRFARGDISTDEFLERSSILNWTPGSDTVPARRPRKR